MVRLEEAGARARRWRPTTASAPFRCRSSRRSRPICRRPSWRRRAACRDGAGKVGWQAERFWETEDQIYGGISWTTDVITQIWYPSSGFLSAKGALTGAYMYGPEAETFNAAAGGRAPACRPRAGRAAACGLRRTGAARRRDRLGPDGVRPHGMGRRRQVRTLRRMPRSWRSRRAGSFSPAISSPGGPAGRKARSCPPGRR